MLESEDKPALTVGQFQKSQPVMEELTFAVMDEEPCFGLSELDLPAEDGTGSVRFQRLRLVRQDRLATAWIKLGPSENYTSGPLVIPGGMKTPDGRIKIWHTVRELREAADMLRGQKPVEVEPWDIQTSFQEDVEERPRVAKSQSTYGYGGVKVRNR